MELLGGILVWVGLIIAVIGGIWMLIEQFSTSILWGVGCLLCGVISLIWLVTHFDRGMYPFLTSLAVAIIYVIGGVLLGEFPHEGY
mgnify:CR=1 FL=1